MGGLLIWLTDLAKEVQPEEEYYEDISNFMSFSWILFWIYFISFCCCNYVCCLTCGDKRAEDRLRWMNESLKSIDIDPNWDDEGEKNEA